MNLRERFVSGILTGMGSVVIKTGLNILLIPMLIHTLGPAMYGLYVLLVGVLELALMLDLGFTAGLVTLLGKETDDTPELLAVGQWLYLACAVLLFALGLPLVPLFGPLFHLDAAQTTVATQCVLIILLEAGLTLYANYFRAVLVARTANHWSNAADTLYYLVGNAVGLALLWSGYGLVGLLLARLAAAALRTGMLMVKAHVYETGVFRFTRPKWAYVKTLFGLSAHAAVINASIYLSHGIDAFVIGRFLTLPAVGLYELVFRFMSIAMNMGSKVCEGLMPLFAKMDHEQAADKTSAVFLKMSFVNNLITSLILLMIVLYYPTLFSLFSAGKMPIEPTWPVLAMAVVIYWSGALQLPASYYLFSTGDQRFLSTTSIIAALANVVISIALVPHYGLTGVALGTLIPNLLQHQFGLIWRSCQRLEISFTEYVKTVHTPVVMPLSVAAFWVMVGQSVMGVGVLSMVLVGGSGCVVAILAWLLVQQEDRANLLKMLERPIMRLRRVRHA
jgi:O-antigen/teichoic acid export membrane protein